MIWCVNHDSQRFGVRDLCWRAFYGASDWPESCRMVEALLIVKENGEWPAWAMACATQGWYAPTPSKQALIVLDALASVGET